MEIRKSTINDLDEMLNIFKIAKKFMIETGNPNQWTDNYPSVQMIENDINKQESYVCVENGEIVATFAYSTEGEETYNVIDGNGLMKTIMELFIELLHLEKLREYLNLL